MKANKQKYHWVPLHALTEEKKTQTNKQKKKSAKKNFV